MMLHLSERDEDSIDAGLPQLCTCAFYQLRCHDATGGKAKRTAEASDSCFSPTSLNSSICVIVATATVSACSPSSPCSA